MEKERRRHARAKIKWPVVVQRPDGRLKGETVNFSTNSAFIRCTKPLRLNEIFDMTIDAPDRRLQLHAEVIWSNIHGKDDEVTPRGMGVRFLDVSIEDREFIAEVLDSLTLSKVATEYLRTLEKELGMN